MTNLTVTEYSSFREAKQALKEGEFLNINLSKQLTKVLANRMNDFNGIEYTRNEITKILDDKDINAFQNICPLYFHSMNMFLSPEQEKTFVESLTPEQLVYFPTAIWKLFSHNALELLQQRISEMEDRRHKTFYAIETRYSENKEEQVVVVEDILLSRMLSGRLNTSKPVHKETKEERDFSSVLSGKYISLTEIADYLGVEKRYVVSNFYEKKGSNLMRYLDIPNLRGHGKQIELKSAKLKVTTASFKKYLKVIYSGNLQEIPKSGLYDWRELSLKSGVSEDLTRSMLYYNLRKGIVNGYRVSDRLVRFSKEDFDEFNEHRRARVTYSRSLLQFPMNVTKEEVDKILEDYMEDMKLWGSLGISSKEIQDVTNYRSLPMVKMIRPQLNLYFCRETNKSYYFKEDINRVMSQYYGYVTRYGEFKEMLTFNIDVAKRLYRLNDVVSEISRIFNLNEKKAEDVRHLIKEQVLASKLPVVKTGERRTLFILEDVINSIKSEIEL